MFARANEDWSLPMITLALTGDVMLGGGMNDALREMRPTTLRIINPESP